jgi:hypothetical protein
MKKLLLFLLISLSLLGAEKKAIRRSIFTGMNTKSHASLIGPTECVSLKNIDLSEIGNLKKRLGYVTFDNDVGSLPFNNMVRFNPSGGTNSILGVEGTNLRYSTGAGTWSAAIKSNLTSDLYTLFVVGKNVCLVSNGTENVHSVAANFAVSDEGDTNTDPPKGTVGVFFNSRFYIAKDQYLYFSDVVTAAGAITFDRTNNLFPINYGDNDEITNIVPYTEDQLIIFKEHSTWWLNIPTNTDPLDNWFLKPIDKNFGAVCKDGAVKAGDEIYYIAHDGLRSLKRTAQDKLSSVSVPISDNIYNDHVENIRASKISNMRLVYFDNKIIWGVPIDHDYIDKWFVYFLHKDPSYNGWAVWETIPTTNFVKWFEAGEENLFFSDGLENGQVFEMFSGIVDNATTINFELISRKETLNNEGYAANTKYGISLYIKTEPYESSTFRVDGQANEAGFELIENNINIDVDNPTLPVTMPFYLSNITSIQKKISLTKFNHWYDFQLKITQTGSNMSLSLLDYMMIVNIDKYLED